MRDGPEGEQSGHFGRWWNVVSVVSLSSSLTWCYSAESTMAPPTSPPPMTSLAWEMHFIPDTDKDIHAFTRSETRRPASKHAVRQESMDMAAWESSAGWPDKRPMKMNESSLSDRRGSEGQRASLIKRLTDAIQDVNKRRQSKPSYRPRPLPAVLLQRRGHQNSDSR